MKTIAKKKIGLLAQYFLWAMLASSYSGTTHLRLAAFVIGLMILMTLAGMQLRDILGEIHSNREKSIFLFSLAFCMVFVFFLFFF